MNDPTARAKYDRHRNSQAGEASRNANKGSNQPPPRGPSTAPQNGKPRPGFSFMKPQNPPRSPYPGHQPGGWPTTPGTQTSHPRWRPPPGEFGRFSMRIFTEKRLREPHAANFLGVRQDQETSVVGLKDFTAEARARGPHILKETAMKAGNVRASDQRVGGAQ